MRLRLIALLLLPSIPAFATDTEGTLEALWHSRYISEGRDNLDGSGLYTASASLSAADASIGVWQGWEEHGPYRENNLYAEYAPTFGEWTPYLNLTYLQFYPDAPDDLEAGFGIARNLTRIISLAFDGSWSKEAEGSFYALSLLAENDLTDTLNANLRLTQTYDHGYASDIYNGLNNTEAAIGFSWTGLSPVTFHAGWQHSWAGEDVRRDGGEDESWGQVGMSTYF